MKAMILALLVAADPTARALDAERVLQAIAEVETHGRDSAVGKIGERSRYQFREMVWREYSSADFKANASDPDQSHAVALRHYAWICRSLARLGKPVDAWWIAATWNAGLGRIQQGRIPHPTLRYAERVARLAGI